MIDVRGRVARRIDGLLETTVAGSFTRIGIETRRRLEGWDPIPDLHGRTVLVTGATSGIGRAAATGFVRAGAHVTIVGRDAGRLAAAVAGTGAADSLLADLSDLDQAQALVDAFVARHDALDVLVHNAGALVPDFRITPQGFEDTYASQVLSPHLITAGLLPLLQRSQGRVITVSSGGMYTQRLHPDHVELGPDEFDGVRAYALAKRAQVTLTQEWARRFGETVAFWSMHPGWADTPGVRSSLPAFARVTGPFLRTPEQGADTILWLAGSDEARACNGAFWLDRRPRSTGRWPVGRPDARTAAELWTLVCCQSGTRPSAPSPADAAAPAHVAAS